MARARSRDSHERRPNRWDWRWDSGWDSRNFHFHAWLAALFALFIVALMLWSRSAAGQGQRAAETVQEVMRLTPDLASGAQLYATNCATCHGTLGLGVAEKVIPAVAGQLPVYVVKQLVDIGEGDRALTEMHRVLARKELVSPQAIRDVAAFVGSLKPNLANEVGDGKNVALGSQLYVSMCAACHGENAQGNSPALVPALNHQHYSYLLSRMRQFSVDHRSSVDIEVIERLQALSLLDLTALADAISRKGRPASAKVPSETNGMSNSGRSDDR